jgi:hypothetical protein
MITRRRALATTGGLAALAAAGLAAAETPTPAVSTKQGIGTMEIKRNGSRPSAKGPADYFTGAVRIDPLFQAPEPARATGASVTFEPGARTAWHTASARSDINRHIRSRMGTARGRNATGRTIILSVRDPDETDRVFATLPADTDAVLIENSIINILAMERICALAAQRGLPAVGTFRELADAGCLMSYGEIRPLGRVPTGRLS